MAYTYFSAQGEIPPAEYQSTLTIKYILLNCVDCMGLHQQFHIANNMLDLITKVKQENIFAFLRRTSYNLSSKNKTFYFYLEFYLL